MMHIESSADKQTTRAFTNPTPPYRIACLLGSALLLCSATAAAQAADEQPAATQPARQPTTGTGASSAAKSGIVPPRLLHFEPAVYPSEAQRLGLDASVVLRISIDADGQVTRAEVAEAAGQGFDEAAVDAAMRFLFEPATRDGVAVPARILYRYAFRFEPKPPSVSDTDAADSVPTVGELRGKIVAGSPPAPLSGVGLRIRRDRVEIAHIVTSNAGTFKVEGLSPGDYDIELDAVGYRSGIQRERVEAGRATDIVYGLEHSEDTPIEVTVRGTAIHREVTHYDISRRELERVPGTFGDAIHAVEAMPSVARPPAFSGALIVRGSAPQDTQVFIDGTLVPRVFHYGSLSSVVPSEMIEKLEFYPSNFSARYGRGMGGIVDVTLRQTNPDGRYHGSAQADFINLRANAEGPIPGANGWNFMGGFRTSYVDRWLVPVLRSSGSGIDGMPRYYDYQLYLERRLPQNGVFRVGFIGAHDIYVPIKEDVKDWNPPRDSFGHFQAQLRMSITSALDFKAVWSMGRMQNSAYGDDGRTNETTANLATARSELAVKTGTFGIARIGADVFYAPFTVQAVTDSTEANGELSSRLSGSPELSRYDIHGVYLRPATYVEYELAPTRRVNVTAGMRLDYTKDTDSSDVAPRLSGRYVLVDGPISTVARGGIGLFYQPPDPAQTLPGLGNPALTSSRALHAALGVEQALSKRVVLSVEGFDKELSHLVSRHTDASGNRTADNSGHGHVVGMDFLLRYRPDDRFFGWIAYTLSRSTRQLAPEQPTRLFIYDETHILNVLASYRLGRGWELGGRFRYMSGFLYNSCFGGLFDNARGSYRCYGPQAQTRMAPFHQLDLRVEKMWQYPTFRWSAYLDVINAYYHSSPDFAIPNYDLSGVKTKSLSLPLIPSIGVRGEL